MILHVPRRILHKDYFENSFRLLRHKVLCLDADLCFFSCEWDIHVFLSPSGSCKRFKDLLWWRWEEIGCSALTVKPSWAPQDLWGCHQASDIKSFTDDAKSLTTCEEGSLGISSAFIKDIQQTASQRFDFWILPESSFFCWTATADYCWDQRVFMASNSVNTQTDKQRAKHHRENKTCCYAHDDKKV